MSQINDNLVELAYSKYSGYYSKKNYISNEPIWNQLSDNTKDFWRNFVFGIQHSFKGDFIKPTLTVQAPK